MKLIQTFAVLEVVHVVFKLVKSPLSTTFIQGRLCIICIYDNESKAHYPSVFDVRSVFKIVDCVCYHALIDRCWLLSILCIGNL